ncbi:hypothetical protein C0Z16_34755 [Paraburkholderia rhynchosiae]|uniref:Uncharacterized protein n=1 Tax=Paraburkholderia rhynchosiae TaxID=487049 RepID=A0ABX4UU32_9BURK|nr:hypothetical protein C0Z16_34755 [Paraburkholderia rhynchosiae]
MGKCPALYGRTWNLNGSYVGLARSIRWQNNDLLYGKVAPFRFVVLVFILMFVFLFMPAHITRERTISYTRAVFVIVLFL